jgi:NAD(P)-dependent dehydrogenase (short-subunit alcohol dehydrogenase family)
MAPTVLVTGAAGAIGSATVAWLQAQGHRVVGLDRKPAPACPAAAEWIQHDLLDTRETERLLAESPLLDGLQHIVAVAGGPTEEEVGRLDPAEVPVEVFDASVQLNLVAQYAIVRAGADRAEVETPDGDRSITLISSVNALRGYGMPGYSAAKAGLLGLVVALALPLGRRGLRINAVVPGTVITNGFSRGYAKTAEVLGTRLLEAGASTRGTRPEDVARAISAVLGLEQMTGQHLVIDGGQLAAPFDRYPLV